MAQASDELNQQAGYNKAIPHVAARNIKHEDELEDFIKFCTLKGIHKALVIGGSIPRHPSNIFQNDIDVATILKKANKMRHMQKPPHRWRDGFYRLSVKKP